MSKCVFGFTIRCVVSITLLICPCCFANEKDDRVPLKLTFLSSTSYTTAKLFAGAFFTALDHVNNNATILEGYKLEYYFTDTKKSSLDAINAMTSHYWNDTVGFIGPDVSCLCESTVAAAWNLPMVAYKCHDSKIGRRETVEKRTFARTQPSTSKISKYIISLLKYYEWKRFTMVVGASSIWNETSESLQDLSKLNNIYVNKVAYFKEPYAYNEEIYSRVENTHSNTRIYVFLGDYHALIDFVRLLKKLIGDLASDYVVIAMDERLFVEDPERYIARAPFEKIGDLELIELQSFETVLLLVPRPPINDQWDAFLDDVRLRNSKEPINGMPVTYAGSPIEVPIYAAFLYDAVNTYANALDEVVRGGGSVTNGTLIIDHMRNRTFTSILGYEVYVDKDGDAEGNYTLLTFRTNPETRDVSVIPNANFRMTENGTGIPELNMFNEISWPNNKPPADEPDCGFHGEKCIQEFNWQLATIIIIVVTATLIAGGFFLRHYLYEQKLARLLWKVDFKDIVLVDSVDDIIPPARKKRRRSKGHPWKFIISNETESERTTLLGDNKREKSTSSDYSKRSLIGSYKGTIVSVKHIIKKNVEIDRDLKKQLQLRKELNHDNIARFLGACVETPHVYILTQYSQRGSLKDILENEDFSLDDMFITSLVSDLLKGMTFIHDSEICSHGNLKSSNCLVDARWVLVVSDFGLHKLDNERSGSVTDVKRYYDRLLWTAPELLRNINRNPAGTQKGDVYAFAFILYEMIGRRGPWGYLKCSSKEIVENVKRGDPHFRPNVSDLKLEPFLSDCLTDCWHEDPELRPDFKYIRFRLKPMLQGIKSNIFDNMIEMMEKYANNLEGLVAERTELLSEEKKMTENLLLRMLPRFVADRLKRGEPVVPEHYDCVSIYFSDIVGFTALSAESTPMEVVCMLNDLYTCFDSIIENYDCYKIETIGDAYFVVSGLPVRNEDLHAGEIASLSLHMQRVIQTFKIKHRPDDTLKLRIGIHSGPCVAGVVGLKMPRYTLFGDTVNTASRMETTGVPLKIHCSSEITALLHKLGGYRLVERGLIEAKGKGEMLTYFLEGEDESHRQRRISNTKFSRTNSPTTPVQDLPAMFGSTTLHPKYWQNGGVGGPANGSAIPTFQSCDNFKRKSFDFKALCDKERMSTDQPSQGATSFNVRLRRENRTCSAPHFNHDIIIAQPVTPLTTKGLTSGACLNKQRNANSMFKDSNTHFGVNHAGMLDNGNSIEVEHVPLLRRLDQPSRQTSLPTGIIEESL